jgi:sugar phosphate isomerase/epimerase
MSLSTLPLSYCTNVHPGMSVEDVVQGLQEYTSQLPRLTGRRVAAGLWLAAAVVQELEQDAAKRDRLRSVLADHELVCYTLNAFPYGNFHSTRVKEQVYLPDWTTDARRDYSLSCARLLGELLPPGVEGSLSTVPLGFKTLATAESFERDCIAQLLQFARALDELHDETGQVVRLAIEPEPLCVLETTAETLAFFSRLWAAAESAGLLDVARRHLGVCYDVCHQSVEFEDVADSIFHLQDADVRINKVHITCAVRLPNPGENSAGRAALAHFIEPRYLHQTLARAATGSVIRHLDLDAALCDTPTGDFASANEWRVHFHVPVSEERIGPLLTTQDDLRAALSAVSRLPYAPHLEVETYTWGVLPGATRPPLAEGIAAELRATWEMLNPFRETT